MPGCEGQRKASEELVCKQIIRAVVKEDSREARLALNFMVDAEFMMAVITSVLFVAALVGSVCVALVCPLMTCVVDSCACRHTKL